MSGARSAREEILGRIRSLLPGEPSAVVASYRAISREYARRGGLNADACVDLFADRLRDYDSDVVRADDESQVGAAVGAVLKESGEDRLLVSLSIASSWLPVHISPIFDDGLSSEDIDRAQAVLTSCAVAVASTGTIFLVHSQGQGKGQGRRAITLLPDHHICVVRCEQIYETLPEALAILDQNDPRPMTSISGPSATSDIEMTRIRGVHGPRRLTVVLCGPFAER